MASTGLTKTFGAGNRRTWTLSLWVKRSGLTGVQCIMAQEDGWNGNGDAGIYFDNDGISSYNLGDTLNSGNSSKVGTNRLFRDTNAWFHLVFRFDSTQSTASDRFRIYVNGVQETSMLYSNYPSQNYEPNFNRSTRNHGIGKQESGTAFAFDGSMSHIHFCDGYSYDASSFGETDSTTGEWKIKTSPSVSYGTTGFFILKDGNSVTDQSGNSNNWTVGGTLTKTEDCPSNVFATLNPLHRGTKLDEATFSNGNTKHEGTTSGGSYPYSFSTLAASSGKWYAEFKNSPSGDCIIGIGAGIPDGFLGNATSAYSVGYFRTGQYYISGSGNTYGSALSNNDIVGVAMDLDNNKLYFSINGTWQNSGDPTSGSTGTGAISITGTASNTTGFYHFACGKAGSDPTSILANFGNGYFGTTAVSSAGTNASGNGIFEYDCPQGYTALSTKGLNL